MKFIAFDTALRKTGVAYQTLDGHWATAVVDVRDNAALALLLAEAKAEAVTGAVIEDCFFGVNVLTLKRLLEGQTRIRVLCELAGFEVIELIQPSTWQSAFRIGGDRQSRKVGARYVAKMSGYTGTSEDEADAVCLCEFAQSRSRQTELVLTRPRRTATRA